MDLIIVSVPLAVPASASVCDQLHWQTTQISTNRVMVSLGARQWCQCHSGCQWHLHSVTVPVVPVTEAAWHSGESESSTSAVI